MQDKTKSPQMLNVEDVHKLRKRQLYILDTFDAICKKYGFQYWLDFGTLLGAVRNGAFIPWDDDIDVSMPIDDYMKFLDVANDALPENIFLQTTKTDPAFKQCFAKLRDCYSTFIENHETGVMPYHQGIFIDIFPSCLYPRMPKLFRKVLMRTTVRSRYAAFVNKENIWLSLPIYCLCKLIWLLLSPFKKVAFGQIPEDNGYMYATPLEYLHPLGQITFEEKNYPCPRNPHEHLSRLYGPNYMLPPPDKNRVPHGKLILLDTPCQHPRALQPSMDAR
ncbi:LicD family protein [Oxalobacter sp. OttesenSCG-928-P03]|nr:LicD family protein [Oxalobacter sp. OttesenSCG-928-P03]